MKTTIVTPPTYFPVTLDEVKDHLNVTFTTDDSLLRSFISIAVNNIENYIGRKLVNQTWYYFLQEWPAKTYIELPYPPLSSVTAVTYLDTDESRSTFSSDDYIVDTDSEPGRIVLGYEETWPTTTLSPNNPIRIEFVCGYGAHTPLTITGATNAAPIVITSTAHGLTSNDVVKVDNVGGNTAADGEWVVSKVDANSFQLLGSTGNAAYTSGGTATKIDVPQGIKNAIMLLVGDMYENRESLSDMKMYNNGLIQRLVFDYRTFDAGFEVF